MKLNKHVIALATTTALIGAGLAVPTSNAQDNVQPFAAITAESADSAAVEGFTWPEKDITAGGEAVKITKIAEIKTGGVAINGGYDNGGITLFPGDGGTYYQVKENDAKTYQEVGTATLPLGDKFELIDNANNDNKKLTAQDMTALKDDGNSFNVNNTTATVENGVITNITRVYTP